MRPNQPVAAATGSLQLAAPSSTINRRTILFRELRSSEYAMQAPSATDLLNEQVVQQALEQAWNDSLPGDSVQRHEEGGWIYVDTTTGIVVVRRAPAGAQTTLDLSV